MSASLPAGLVVRPYRDSDRTETLELSLRSWQPVFNQLIQSVPRFVYDSFYPDGWAERQSADLAALLDSEPENIDVAEVAGRDFGHTKVVGWVCTRLHPEDHMGEVYVVAVDPAFQRQGVGRALLDCADRRAVAAGMRMIMVETGDDPGHASSRASYESAGYQRWPVARYFKDLVEPQF